MGIDVGTSALKLLVMDAGLRSLAWASRTYSAVHPRKGWSELPAGQIWQALRTGVEELAGRVDLGQVAGIGFSCLCPGLTALDEDGGVLCDPIIHNDQRSRAESWQLRQRMAAEEVFAVTGNPIMPGAISCTSMLWIKEHRPEVYARAAWFGHINTLLSVWLTGQAAIDPTNASYTGLYDTRGGSGWSDVLCRMAEIDRAKLPPILEPTAICGYLQAEELTSLGLRQGTPVVIGAADTPCAALAAGGDLHQEVFESIGSTGVVSFCTEQPRFSRAFLNRRYLTPDCWLYQGASSNMGLAIAWAERELCRDIPSGRKGVLDMLSRRSSAGANGCVFLPYLSGERSPIWDPDARGVFFGLSAENDREDMARAVLESGCYSARQMFQAAEEVTGRPCLSVLAAGGGTRSDIWMQLRADITERELRVLEQPDMAAAGAAMLAAVGTGQFPNLETARTYRPQALRRCFQPKASPGERRVYRERYEQYLELYDCLKGLFKKAGGQEQA